MITNEINFKICLWLGFRQHTIEYNFWWNKDEAFIPDFLHDRNQQRWIEEKICEKYDLSYHTIDGDWVVLIEERHLPPDWEPFASSRNKSKDQAFVDAVMELIEKERTK